MIDLELAEKAMRNIIRGRNAKTYLVGAMQARLVRVMQEEGVVPLELIQKGLARPIERKDSDDSEDNDLNDLMRLID